MIINYNGTYRGFILIYDVNGNIKARKNNATCCQVIRDMKTEDIDRIVFGFPDDWLPNEFRNDEFLIWWCKIVSGWFTEVKYTGKGKGSDLETSCAAINNENGYNTNSGHPATFQELPINKGDLIINNVWRMFEIKCNHKQINFAIFNYTAFVLIRYLFCTYCQSIVKNYLNYKYYLTDVDRVKHPSDLEEFKLFQLAHYGEIHRYYADRSKKTYVAGYNKTYAMIPYFPSTTSSAILTDVEHRPYKLVSVTDCKSRLEHNPVLNSAFTNNIIYKITVNQVNELLKRQKIYEAYEAIN